MGQGFFLGTCYYDTTCDTAFLALHQKGSLYSFGVNNFYYDVQTLSSIVSFPHKVCPQTRLLQFVIVIKGLTLDFETTGTV